MKPLITTGELLVLSWFGFSILSYVLSTAVFSFWLRRQGVGLISSLTGTPGYLEYRYWVWCTSRGRSPRRAVALRALLLVNTIAACAFAYPILSRSSEPARLKPQSFMNSTPEMGESCCGRRLATLSRCFPKTTVCSLTRSAEHWRVSYRPVICHELRLFTNRSSLSRTSAGAPRRWGARQSSHGNSFCGTRA